MLKKALSLAALLAVGLSVSAHAAVTYELKQGFNEPVKVEPDQQVLLYFPNRMPGPKKIVLGDSATTVDILPWMQDTYYLDSTKLKTVETPFKVVSENGNQIAEGKIINEHVYMNTTSLQSIINYNSSYTWDKKSEPTYYGTSSGSRKTIRGYW